MMKRVVLAGLVFAASGAISNAGAQTVDAKTVYDANCRKCHGVAGTPPKAMAAKFPKIAAFDAAFFAKRSDDSVVKVLTNGKSCLLYTSDAADDLLCVDLGVRR